ncbi:iron-sulfur cluster repair di-iron protein [Fodinibius salsisoli]|uniref:Iron-sulfur cluster repair di-iron protein n=1 Tax=Fodinibius salsisoli TaxID=2820877 RepID=A0ABT3PN02_9BACT|nr:iron-sulfur cluster repair di-iron protein [Fodinibius salsisoli]MCW9707311.1 iron-sulfur cluster repair di-iron protein [Fodinibius salsisoli]
MAQLTAPEKTIGEIVAEDYRTAGIFKKFGMDFCCGGGRSIAEACKRKDVDMDVLLSELDNITKTKSEDQDNYNEWSPEFLIDYIINNHHHFVRRKLPEVKDYARKVAKVHGKSYPALNKMLNVFQELKEEMLSHLDKEEQTLFPYIKKLREAITNDEKKPVEELQSGLAARAIKMMEEEHDEAGKLMAELERLSSGFTPPEDACTTFRVYFQNLKGFQDDLFKHVHLENNILFPKALRLEEQLN